MVAVKVLCQLQPVMQIKRGSIAKLLRVCFLFAGVSFLVCKMFPA